MKKGEIFIVKQATHPVIFIEPKNEIEFFGVILTHSHINKSGKNVQMKQEYFEEHDETGEKYSVQHDQTFVHKKHLIKKNDWEPLKKVGNLTSIGNEFIDAHMDDFEPFGWGELSGRKKP